jgi:hypothetical protein
LNSVNSKTTDDRGEYRLFYLPPGEYLIGATLRRVSNTPSPQDSYARTFYPGTADGNAAARVKVAEGSGVTGIDIDMRAGASGTVSGRLVTSFTQPANFFLVPQGGGGTLFDPATMNYQNQSSNRTNGEFELRGMFPGSYELIATIPGLNGVQVQAMGRTRVQVPEVGIAGNVTVTLKPPQQLNCTRSGKGAMGAPGTTSCPPFPAKPELYSALFEANAVTYSIDVPVTLFSNIIGWYTVSLARCRRTPISAISAWQDAPSSMMGLP